MCYPAAEQSLPAVSILKNFLLTHNSLVFNNQILNCEQLGTYNAIMQPLFFFFPDTQNLSHQQVPALLCQPYI